MAQSEYKQCKSAFKKASNILILTPPTPDNDTICGALALHTFFQRSKKTSTCVIPGDIPKKLSFLGTPEQVVNSLQEKQNFVLSISTKNGHADRIKYRINNDSIDIIVTPKDGFFNPKDVQCFNEKSDFDCIIILNADTPEDLGDIFTHNPEMFTQSTVVNIGSSHTNDEYGSINIVDTTTSGASEQIQVLLESEKEWNDTLATILLSGVISATESFLGTKSTPSSFEVAGKLQQAGANHSDVIENIFKMKSLETLKIWGRIMGNLHYDPLHKMSWATISKADLEIAQSQTDDREDITKNILANVGDTEISALIVEDEDETILELASSKNNINLFDLQPGFTEKLEGNPQFVKAVFKKRSSEVEHTVLSVLGKYQKYKLQLDQDLKVESEKIILPEKKVPVKQEKKAKAPATIPFTAPEKERPKKVPNEVKKDSKPKWLE